jgi:hypothetical protein
MKKFGGSLLVLLALLGLGCDEKQPSEDKAAVSKAAAAPAAPAKSVEPAKTPPEAAKPTSAPPAAAAAPPPAAAAAPPVVEAAKPASKTTPELVALDATIKAITDVKDDDARAKALCKALAARTIAGQIKAVGDHPPAGVDATTWRETSESMWGSFTDTEIECVEDSSPNMKVLANAADTRKELDALLPK